jgi:hypothetical protein
VASPVVSASCGFEPLTPLLSMDFGRSFVVVVANVSAVAPSSARCTWAAIFGWGCELFVCDAAAAWSVVGSTTAGLGCSTDSGITSGGVSCGAVSGGLIGAALGVFDCRVPETARGSSSEVGSERLRPSWPAGARSTESSSSVARLSAPVFLLVERLDDAAVFVDALLLTDAVFVDALLLTDAVFVDALLLTDAVFVDALLLTDVVLVDALLLTDVESPAVSSAYATPDPANAPAIPTLTAPAVSHA